MLPLEARLGLTGLRDELATWSIAQSAVGMHLVVMREPNKQSIDDTLRIEPRVCADTRQM